MDYIKTFKTLGQNVLDLVFPVFCLNCKKEGVYLCDDCKPALVKIEKLICAACSSPSPFGLTHEACKSRNKIDGLISCLDYANPKNIEIIGAYKYKFVEKLAQPLSEIMIANILQLNLNEFFKEFTIIPVPLHKKRFLWRGFNQSEILALELAKKLGLSMEKDIVVRSRFTKPQTKLNSAQRQSNIKNAFEVNKTLKPTKILIVDDVFTTGATVNEIARILKQNGAKDVWALTLAHG